MCEVNSTKNFYTITFDKLYGIFDKDFQDIGLCIAEANDDILLAFTSEEDANWFVGGGYKEYMSEDGSLGYYIDQMTKILDSIHSNIIIKPIDYNNPVKLIVKR